MWYTKMGGKFIVENELVNPFARRGMRRKFPKAQAYVISRDAGVKLYTPDFQGGLQPKKSPIKEKIENSYKKKVAREAADRRNQSGIRWQKEDDQIETLSE